MTSNLTEQLWKDRNTYGKINVIFQSTRTTSKMKFYYHTPTGLENITQIIANYSGLKIREGWLYNPVSNADPVFDSLYHALKAIKNEYDYEGKPLQLEYRFL